MKYKYCPVCKKAYVKSRLEKDRCIYCGEACRIVDVKKSPMYYLGYFVLILGAVVVFLLRALDTILIWLVFAFFLVLGGVLVVGASNRMARDAASRVTDTEEELK